MKTISYIVTDRRTKNSIIAKICKENNIDNSNYTIYCNKYFNYMEYDNNISITLLSTIHKGIKYTFEYFSGCFNAYMVANVIDYKYNINEFNHYILYSNEGVKVHTEAGWQINNDPQRLFTNYIKKRK